MHILLHKHLQRVMCLVVPGALCTLLALNGHAATIVVNTADNTPGAVDCSLREALTSAQMDDNSWGNGSCASGNGADTIVFDPAVFPAGSITAIALAGNPIDLSFVTSDITIDGDQRVALDAGNASRLVSAQGSGLQLTLRGLTLRGGQTAAGEDGGGIYLDSGVILRVERCMVQDNQAGINGAGLYSRDSTVTIVDSVFTGNQAGGQGGAIYSTGSGSLTVERSRLSGNTARTLGGGLRSGVPTTMTDSIVTGNALATPGSGAGLSFTLNRPRALNGNQVTNNAPGNNCGGEPFTGADNRYWPSTDTSCPAAAGAIAKAPQAILFTTAPPAGVRVGGTYDVAAAGGASGNPVTFAVDASTAAICSASGSTILFHGAGTCTINASQPGDADHEAAPQAAQTVAVGQGAARVTLASSANPSRSGHAVTFSVSVALDAIQGAAPAHHSVALPTGTVDIMVGGVPLGTVSLSNAAAVLATAQLTTAGSHGIVARYSGDANYLAANSAVWVQTVEPGASPSSATPVPSLGPGGLLLTVLLTGFMGLRLRRVRGG